MKVLYSGFIDANHSQCGGYDKIINIELDKKVLLSKNYIGGHIPVSSYLVRIPFSLLDLHTRILRYRYDITHLFYGELTSLPILPYPISKKHKTVITLHLKVEDHRFLKLYLNQLRKFDGIIVLSSNQKELLQEKYGIKSTFIPHGFSKPKFEFVQVKDLKNRAINHDQINISTIGSNYRDFDTLKFIINKFSNNKKIHFHLVGVPQEIKEFAKDKENVSIYGRLDNNQYYTFLTQVDYNFLPLTFATANNTLLEAQFLNTPSILPSIPGVNDYAAPAPYNIFYKTREDIINIINKLEKKRKDPYLEIFAHKHFDWNIIYSQLIQYYDKILAGSI